MQAFWIRRGLPFHMCSSCSLHPPQARPVLSLIFNEFCVWKAQEEVVEDLLDCFQHGEDGWNPRRAQESFSQLHEIRSCKADSLLTAHCDGLTTGQCLCPWCSCFWEHWGFMPGFLVSFCCSPVCFALYFLFLILDLPSFRDILHLKTAWGSGLWLMPLW